MARQLLADLLGREVQFHPLRSASAIGAAMLAAEGVGDTLAPERPEVDAVSPGVKADRARDAFDRWRELALA